MTRLTITDLQFGQCRFPVTPDSAPKHFFCGEPTEHEKSPYCSTHAALCFDRRAEAVKTAARQRAAVARAAKQAQAGCLPFGRRPSTAPKF